MFDVRDDPELENWFLWSSFVLWSMELEINKCFYGHPVSSVLDLSRVVGHARNI